MPHNFNTPGQIKRLANSIEKEHMLLALRSQGLTYRDIGEKVGLSVSGVAEVIRRGTCRTKHNLRRQDASIGYGDEYGETLRALAHSLLCLLDTNEPARDYVGVSFDLDPYATRTGVALTKKRVGSRLGKLPPEENQGVEYAAPTAAYTKPVARAEDKKKAKYSDAAEKAYWASQDMGRHALDALAEATFARQKQQWRDRAYALYRKVDALADTLSLQGSSFGGIMEGICLEFGEAVRFYRQEDHWQVFVLDLHVGNYYSEPAP